MAQGILTPLQLTAASALLANTGIKPLPTALTTAVAFVGVGFQIVVSRISKTSNFCWGICPFTNNEYKLMI